MWGFLNLIPVHTAVIGIVILRSLVVLLQLVQHGATRRGYALGYWTFLNDSVISILIGVTRLSITRAASSCIS